ncbi:glycosyltransferase family 88 protein [Candidatus Berkiella aquae]|uniref:Lgt1 glycosyltransferase domain-containing protein n=1 Tax=Candidatus Berkiella aquae TaxID=295108 RepID=A0A0Q9YJL7_9GAMM|nr:glycosyltransferase family 88 protein [Candidatus Berkiella aquae]MCS5711330.1 hypothetical protein [Candidatus Berkiella aquae]
MLSGIQSILEAMGQLFLGESGYLLDLSRIGFIWFSDNPNEFMPAAHKLRLIQNRQRNPKMSFYFGYSSRYLSEQANQELAKFAAQLNLYLVDFDNDLKHAAKSSIDEAIYAIADEELSHAMKTTGGNLAAASDCVRSLERFLDICSNYIDCDVDFDFSQMPKFLRVKEPIIFPGRGLDFNLPGGLKVPSMSNYFIGAAVVSEYQLYLHPDAKEKLKDVKEAIREHYLQPHVKTLLLESAGSLSPFARQAGQLIKKLFEQSGNDIFKYRTLVNNLPNVYNAIKPLLLKDSVVKYSGPDAWFLLYKDDILFCRESQSLLELPNNLQRIVAAFENASELNNGMQDCFPQYDEPEQQIMGQLKGDLSWLPSGKSKLEAQSQKIEEAAKTFQKAIRSRI